MEIIKRDDIVREAPDRWAAQHKDGKYGDRKIVTSALRFLQESGQLTKENVDKTIGNDSWTRLECSECGKDVECVVEFAANSLGEARICPDCIREAVISLELTVGE